MKGMYCKAKNIVTENNAEDILRSILKDLGYGFHPDDPFYKYVYTTTRMDVYTQEEAEIAEDNLSTLHAIYGDSIYQVCLDILERRNNHDD